MDGWMDGWISTLNLSIMAKIWKRFFELRLKTLQCQRDLLSTTLAQALVSPPSIEWKKKYTNT